MLLLLLLILLLLFLYIYMLEPGMPQSVNTFLDACTCGANNAILECGKDAHESVLTEAGRIFPFLYLERPTSLN